MGITCQKTKGVRHILPPSVLDLRGHRPSAYHNWRLCQYLIKCKFFHNIWYSIETKCLFHVASQKNYLKQKLNALKSEMCIATHCSWASQTYYKIVTTWWHSFTQLTVTKHWSRPIGIVVLEGVDGIVSGEQSLFVGHRSMLPVPLICFLFQKTAICSVLDQGKIFYNNTWYDKNLVVLKKSTNLWK